MNYYLVTAKCGHVGRGCYIEKAFPVTAKSKSEAAQIVLRFPRVKKQLKDAIEGVCEITYEEYKEIRFENNSDDYLRAKSKTDYTLNYNEVHYLINHFYYRRKSEFESRLERVAYKNKKNKMKEENANENLQLWY